MSNKTILTRVFALLIIFLTPCLYLASYWGWERPLSDLQSRDDITLLTNSLILGVTVSFVLGYLLLKFEEYFRQPAQGERKHKSAVNASNSHLKIESARVRAKLMRPPARRTRLSVEEVPETKKKEESEPESELEIAEKKAKLFKASIASRKVNLMHLNFKGSDLKDIDLAWGNMSGADFTDANLENANLFRVIAKETIFQGANLNKVRLSGAILSKANLRNVKCKNGNLSEVTLEDTILDNADLNGATLRGALVKEASFINADLRGADLSGARIHIVNFNGARLEGADFTDAVGLTKEHLKQTTIDSTTLLPSYLK